MNTREIANAIKTAIDNPERHPVRFGLVHDVDKEGQLIKVELQPEGDVTPWIRYQGMGIVMGPWQAVSLPKLKAEVLLLATDPDCKSFVAVGGFYNGVDTPPTGYADGQILLKHDDGNALLLDADSTIYLGGKTGARAVVLDTWITNTFNALITALNSHVHPHPMGPTSAPVTPFSSWSTGDVSTKFKGV